MLCNGQHLTKLKIQRLIFNAYAKLQNTVSHYACMYICHPFVFRLKLYLGEILPEFSSPDEFRLLIGQSIARSYTLTYPDEHETLIGFKYPFLVL
jgi:hypothetical protein